MLVYVLAVGDRICALLVFSSLVSGAMAAPVNDSLALAASPNDDGKSDWMYTWHETTMSGTLSLIIYVNSVMGTVPGRPSWHSERAMKDK